MGKFTSGNRPIYVEFDAVYDRRPKPCRQASRYIHVTFLWLYNAELSDFNRYCSGVGPQYNNWGKNKIFNIWQKIHQFENLKK